MTVQNHMPFELPDRYLSELPTGSVKTAVDRLGKMIASGQFPEGSTMPVESEICELLGVSRTVVREAIKVLSGKGMLRTARRYGTRVLSFENWNLLDPDVIMMHAADSPMASKIYAASTELRQVIEPEAARLAATNATDEQLERIVFAADNITPKLYGTEGMLAADFAFHATILEASGNLLLNQMSGLLLALLKFSYPTGAARAPEIKVDQELHIWVAEALSIRDADLAKYRMTSMLRTNTQVAEVILNSAPVS